MLSFLANSIPFLFYLLSFGVPLILYPYTSELFEFNKMILTYLLTAIILCAWAVKSISGKKLIFKRTFLDIPLVLFLSTQFLSTITSIDFRTSLLGYYSRYHGGFLSSLTYAFLYWAFVSNMDSKKTLKTIYILLFSAFVVSVYGILEHFGIDRDIWIQDVQARVFSTLGQPNWLAAWLVALLPISWALTLRGEFKLVSFHRPSIKNLGIIKNAWVWTFLSLLLTLTVIYTKSRSGFIGFIGASLVFWSLSGWLSMIRILPLRKFITAFSCFLLTTLLIIIFSGTPWTSSVLSKISRQGEPLPVQTPESVQIDSEVPISPQLEIDSFSSSDIRKIVWRGAIDVWKHYPVLGSGVETFAYSYYNFRPVEHNLVSEWDFLYNKAHNEYLNIAATTGTLGFVAYLTLIASSVILLLHKSLFNFGWVHRLLQKLKLTNGQRDNKDQFRVHIILIGLLAGYVSIIITNFFGFSVVPVGLEFFLFPAFAFGLTNRQSDHTKQEQLSLIQKTASYSILLITLFFVYLIFRYWYADLLFAKGSLNNDVANYVKAREYLTDAISLSSKEAVFWEELAQSSMGITISLYESNNDLYKQFANSAVQESKKSVELSPKSVNALRKQAKVYLELSPLNDQFLKEAEGVLIIATDLAPTEAKLFYNLGLTYLRMGNYDKADEILRKTIEMKPNYANARIGYAVLLSEKGDKNAAIDQLNFILEKIDPNNRLAKQQLEEISGK